MADSPGVALEPRHGVRRMWKGGPLRQFSDVPAGGHYIRYSSRFLTGFAGSYVCDRCRCPSPGVYLSKPSKTRTEWLCGPCKRVQSTSGDSKPATPGGVR